MASKEHVSFTSLTSPNVHVEFQANPFHPCHPMNQLMDSFQLSWSGSGGAASSTTLNPIHVGKQLFVPVSANATTYTVNLPALESCVGACFDLQVIGGGTASTLTFANHSENTSSTHGTVMQRNPHPTQISSASNFSLPTFGEGSLTGSKIRLWNNNGNGWYVQGYQTEISPLVHDLGLDDETTEITLPTSHTTEVFLVSTPDSAATQTITLPTVADAKGRTYNVAVSGDGINGHGILFVDAGVLFSGIVHEHGKAGAAVNATGTWTVAPDNSKHLSVTLLSDGTAWKVNAHHGDIA